VGIGEFKPRKPGVGKLNASYSIFLALCVEGSVRRVKGVLRVAPLYNSWVAEFKSSNQTQRQIKVHYIAYIALS
jgi:hypothetical protein